MREFDILGRRGFVSLAFVKVEEDKFRLNFCARFNRFTRILVMTLFIGTRSSRVLAARDKDGNTIF